MPPQPFRIPFLNLAVTNDEERLELLDAADAVLRHGRLIDGPEVSAFEKGMADFCGVPEAVGVGSGTDALLLALMAAGIGPGDDVILPALSFAATAGAVRFLGATPIFIDILPNMTIDPALIEDAVTSRTKAVLPVHFTGRMADMERIQAVSDRLSLGVVEDAAPAVGAERNGRRVGACSDFGCLSMNPMKVLGGLGEAGLITARSEADAALLRHLRYHAMKDKELCTRPSLNARLDTLQAAMLLKRLSRIEERIAKRRAIARRYNDAFGNLTECPREEPGERHVYYTYTLLTEDRDRLKTHLEGRGIETKLYFRHLLPDQPAFADYPRFPTTLPVANDIANRLICLPLYPEMPEEHVETVIDGVASFFGVRT